MVQLCGRLRQEQQLRLISGDTEQGPWDLASPLITLRAHTLLVYMFKQNTHKTPINHRRLCYTPEIHSTAEDSVSQLPSRTQTSPVPHALLCPTGEELRHRYSQEGPTERMGV